jgi:hypothetical protein
LLPTHDLRRPSAITKLHAKISGELCVGARKQVFGEFDFLFDLFSAVPLRQVVRSLFELVKRVLIKLSPVDEFARIHSGFSSL